VEEVHDKQSSGQQTPPTKFWDKRFRDFHGGVLHVRTLVTNNVQFQKGCGLV